MPLHRSRWRATFKVQRLNFYLLFGSDPCSLWLIVSWLGGLLIHLHRCLSLSSRSVSPLTLSLLHAIFPYRLIVTRLIVSTNRDLIISCTRFVARVTFAGAITCQCHVTSARELSTYRDGNESKNDESNVFTLVSNGISQKTIIRPDIFLTSNLHFTK